MTVAKPAKRSKRNNPRGRPPYRPTEESRKFVKAMAQVGIAHPNIAKIVGIGEVTLRKYYANELDRALIEACGMVGQSLLMQALGGPPTAEGKINWQKAVLGAGIWWDKTRGGRKEIVGHEHAGPGGGPICLYDLSKLTDEELRALGPILEALGRAIAKPGGMEGGGSETGG